MCSRPRSLFVVLSLALLAACAEPGEPHAEASGAVVDGQLLAADVSASWINTCVVTSRGAAKCWGGNYDGQLGSGGSKDTHHPTEVEGLGEGVDRIAAGGSSVCALSGAGGVACWGLNTNGQLGLGTSIHQQRVPAPVVGLASDVIAITLGIDHGCAVLATGRVKCWGANELGQLGNGGHAASSVPVDVVGLVDVARVSSAGAHTCALTTAGAVKCWGGGERGQIGDGASSDRPLPVDVDLGGPAVAISAGLEHACAVLREGGVTCWGRNDLGQVGDGTLDDAAMPKRVRELEQADMVAAGGYHTCAKTTAGAVRCWGLGLSGQLGGGVEVPAAPSPVHVVGLPAKATKVALGLYHSCAVSGDAGVWCWGLNGDAGALGVDPGATFFSSRPLPVDTADRPAADVRTEQ